MMQQLKHCMKKTAYQTELWTDLSDMLHQSSATWCTLRGSFCLCGSAGRQACA